MQHISDINLLNQLKSNAAVFILFGGAHCSICQSLLPQLTLMIEQQFPKMCAVYVDCEKSPDICAQHSVFSLPVVIAYIDGKKIVEEGRAFSLRLLALTIERPYVMWQESITNNEQERN